ncbi:hypothetical protein L596_017863 [Steinernema carpocapsae]|uniref:Uncharacterized protein n=1 Tax=Steinernema carpocapsae TaxID=34508 RepID=A0A4U5N3A6_STECR|nr:hypothetical protein L596_017863 [Steinernema carpocapsae]
MPLMTKKRSRLLRLHLNTLNIGFAHPSRHSLEEFRSSTNAIFDADPKSDPNVNAWLILFECHQFGHLKSYRIFQMVDFA